MLLIKKTIPILFLFLIACHSNKSTKLIVQQCDIIKNDFQSLGEPSMGSWRNQHPEEKEETLEAYIKKRPNSISFFKDKIYILPLGEFSKEQEKIIEETREFLTAYFGLKVVLLPTEKMPIVPSNQQREIDGILQYNARYFIDKKLKTTNYSNAAALIAITSYDLYPEESWNFVFGLSSLQKGVGIWSLYRFGNPSHDTIAYNLCLNRTIKVSSHEISHIFSIKHCKQYTCLLNGANNIYEIDMRPVSLCPNCLAKLSYNFNSTPLVYFERMKKYWISKNNIVEGTKYNNLIQKIRRN